jgi:hypothetical protein
MPLISRLFAGDARLAACLVDDSAHLTIGAHGDHVSKVHTALFVVDGLSADAAELHAKLYGRSTAAAVLAYKKRRRIINYAYQTQEDSIVGKMTIASLDRDVAAREAKPADTPLKPQAKDFV